MTLRENAAILETYLHNIRNIEEMPPGSAELDTLDAVVEAMKAAVENVEYGAFAWDKQRGMFVQIGRSVPVKCRATMFKKGDVPANHMEVGEYTHTTDGYLIRKVKETGPQWERFEFVHRTVWEEHNGPVPEGKMVSFLDGNKDNCNIENLVLIDNEENLEMNRSRLRFADPERTKTGVLVAKARVTVRQKKRRK